MDDEGPTAAEPPSRGGQGATLSIEIIDSERLIDPSVRSWLSDRARASLAPLACTGEVRARLVADAEMARAHARWSGVPGTTDVLTFDLREAPEGPLDVDLLLCADEAARQAAARGHGSEHELLLYLIHGVLHCLGHDDHDEAAAARMHAEEDRLLAASGVGAVYARDLPGPGGRVAPAGPASGGAR